MSLLLALVLALAGCRAHLGSAAPGEAGTESASAGPAAAPSYENVPYRLPVSLPAPVTSPPVDRDAPYTATVVRLLDQLLPGDASPAQIDNAVVLLTGGTNPTCNGPGINGAPAGTTPVIMPLCWVDAQGINWLLHPGETTAPMELVGLAATFDRGYANAWGQVEGREGRQLMMTGLLGPQADLSVFVNWRRAVNSGSGEDPFLGGELAAAQINGMQGSGLMSQLKHFGPYNGTNELKNVTVQDQAMHELLLAPFEQGARKGGVAALMASYQIFEVDAANLPLRVQALGRAGPGWPAGDLATESWTLDRSHFSSEHPWLLTYVLRELWGSSAFVGPDYGGLRSTSAIVQGLDMEPGIDFLGTRNPKGDDPTGSACADPGGKPVDCSTPGAVHVGGIPSAACGPHGCGLADAVKHGILPVSLLRQSLARILYQEERFGLLGCNDATAACPNPGGVNGDRTGRAPLPVGLVGGTVVVGTKNGDAAIVEAGAERGAVLLKNEAGTLPITRADLARGVAVTGGTAEHLVAAPFDEASTGFADRIAIGPLVQLRAMSGAPGAFSYSPANDATGRAVPSSALSASSTAVTGYLLRTTHGGTAVAEATIDYTSTSGHGQLAAGSYTWTGYLHVPVADVYTFRFQLGPADHAEVSFTLDGGPPRTLQTAASIYHGYYYGSSSIPVSRTVAGAIEAALVNLECHAGGLSSDDAAPRKDGAPVTTPNPCPAQLSAGYHAISIRFQSAAPASLRFAYSRARGDITDAADDARGKALAIVFASDDGVKVVTSQASPGPISDASTPVARLPPAQEALIEAVAAANPRTVVVLNTGMPVIVPWIAKVRSVLEMWNAGQEGGTATARLLLGEASPSGHTPITWPMLGTDTIHAYPEPAGGLYPGSIAGPHPERLNGLPGGGSAATQGIFVGYRYYDKLGIPVRFPFGHGLSYTTFRYGGLRLDARDCHVTVDFFVQNTGKVAGTAVPQVYVGPGASAPPGVQQAVHALRGFDRIELGAGETRRVSIALDERSFQYWDSRSQGWHAVTGERQVWVGEGLGDLRLSGSVRVKERSGCGR